MIRAATILLALGWGGALFAAAAEEPPVEAEAEEVAADSGLPRSMRANGVIGRIPSMGEYNLLDPGILTDMRAALILMQDATE